MSNKKSGINIIAPLLLLLALVVYAFSTGFINGVHLLGDILNIFGTVFVWLLKLIFSIPQVAEEIVKRGLTTLLIAVFTMWWCIQDKTEKKVVGIIAKIIVAVFMAILSWVGLF